MEKVIRLPRHELPQLHENATIMSFENCYKLGRVYKEVIGQNGVHHFSLNIVDESGKMSILSYRPQIAYNIFKDGSYLYNGSISKTYYEHREIYTWDEAYDPRYYNILKNNMERKNGIEKGVVLVKKHLNMTILYSFATNTDGEEFAAAINEHKNLFYAMGNHCFSQIKPIIESNILDYNFEKKHHTSNVVRLRYRDK